MNRTEIKNTLRSDFVKMTNIEYKKTEHASGTPQSRNEILVTLAATLS